MGEQMIPLWTSRVVDKIIGSTSTAPWACTGISIDTRTLEKGDLFVALKGDTGNGHAFLKEAGEKGAAAAFVSEESIPLLPICRIQDTLNALERLAKAAVERSSAVRLAVTGSVGKTSTKEMLKWVFKDQGRTHGNVSSYNNHWGVPLTLARMPADTQFAVFEAGMNHTGELRPLSHMISPHIAIITTVATAHVGFFNSLDDIAAAKAEIFEGMEHGGHAILNQDNPYFSFLSERAKDRGIHVVSFGTEGDYRLLSYTAAPEHSTVTASIRGEKISYTLPVPGTHWIFNSLAVLGAVQLAGADIKEAARSIASITPPPGRGNRTKGKFTLLDESYNANPTSMRAALEVLGKSEGNRRIAVIGDMRELGEDSQAYHEELSDPLLKNGIDLVYCCGPYMAYLFDRLPEHMKGGYAPTSLELIPLVTQAIVPGDTISVKGSHGTRMKPIVEALCKIQMESNPDKSLAL